MIDGSGTLNIDADATSEEAHDYSIRKYWNCWLVYYVIIVSRLGSRGLKEEVQNSQRTPRRLVISNKFFPGLLCLLS